jgi:hypothetical protein
MFKLFYLEIVTSNKKDELYFFQLSIIIVSGNFILVVIFVVIDIVVVSVIRYPTIPSTMKTKFRKVKIYCTIIPYSQVNYLKK